MHLFINTAYTKAILLVSIAVIGISVIAAFKARNSLLVQMKFAEQETPGENVRIHTEVVNRSVIPVTRISCIIECENLFNGNTDKINEEFSVGAKEQIHRDMDVDTKYCGKRVIRTSHIYIYDWFGLIRLKIANKTDFEWMVLPQIKFVEVIASNNNKSDLDSERYSLLKSGNDPSEIFSVREYVPGDSTKSIHWKLSEKNDRIMVRELGLPISNRILLVLDMSKKSSTDLREIDNAAVAFASVGEALVREECYYEVAWFDAMTEVWCKQGVNSNESLTAALERIMALPVTVRENSVEEYVMLPDVMSRYAHIAVSSAIAGAELEISQSNLRITVLNNSSNNEAVNWDDNGGVVEI